MQRKTIIGLALVGALAAAAPAMGEKDATGVLGPSDSVLEWDGVGSGGTGLQDVGDNENVGCRPAVHECYDMLIEIKAPGKLTFETSSTDPKAADTDLQIFEADKDGNVKKELAESAAAEPTPAEAATAPVKAGFYIARIDYTIAANATVHGKATFKASAAAAPKPAVTAPGTPGTTTPAASTNATPDAKASKPGGKVKGFSGTASDDSGVAKVEVGVITKPKGGKCKELTASGKLAASKGNCNMPTTFLAAKGTSKWSFKLKKKLAKGGYILFVRAIDNAGATQAGFTPSNKIAFKVK